MLPETVTPDGPRIFLHRAGIYNTDLYSAEDTMRVGMMINDMRMITDDQLIVSGAIAVIDISGMTMNHMLQMTPSFLKQITMLTQEGSPLRSKATHYINIPPSFEIGFNVFKKLLTEKNRSRVRYLQLA
jgi:CRAL/TRIO domain